MSEKEQAFKQYIDEYKKLNTIEKRRQFVKCLRELLFIIDEIAESDNIKLEYMKSNEIKDLQNPNVSEDDFLEAAMVYLEVSKDIIGQYITKIIDK